MAKARAEMAEGSTPRTELSEEPPWMLDEVDERLIGLLEEDGRMSYADLGAAVGLTPGGARARVKRLQERGVIRVIGVTSPHAVGLRNIASLQIEVSGSIDSVANAIASCVWGALRGARFRQVQPARRGLCADSRRTVLTDQPADQRGTRRLDDRDVYVRLRAHAPASVPHHAWPGVLRLTGPASLARVRPVTR